MVVIKKTKEYEGLPYIVYEENPHGRRLEEYLDERKHPFKKAFGRFWKKLFGKVKEK